VERRPASIQDALTFPDRDKDVTALVRSDAIALEEAQQRRSRLPKKSKVPDRIAAIKEADQRLAYIEQVVFKPPMTTT
jgi:hypothetical protein